MSASANSLYIRTTNIEKDARSPEFIAGLLGIWEASVRASTDEQGNPFPILRMERLS